MIWQMWFQISFNKMLTFIAETEIQALEEQAGQNEQSVRAVTLPQRLQSLKQCNNAKTHYFY